MLISRALDHVDRQCIEHIDQGWKSQDDLHGLYQRSAHTLETGIIPPEDTIEPISENDEFIPADIKTDLGEYDCRITNFG